MKTEVYRCNRGAYFVAVGFVVLFGLLQLYMAAFMIPRFSGIYQDMLGGQPLPSATAVVIHWRWALAGFAFVLLIVVSFVVRRRASLNYLFGILMLLVIQIAYVTVVLFLPLIDIRAVAPAG